MALNKGDQVPDFTLKDTKGKDISLSEFKEEKNVVLLFFPLAFSSTCTEELCTTRDNMKFYNSLNAEIFGISVDSFFTLRAYKKAENLNFRLLSDFNKEVSAQYGALYNDYYGMKGVSKRASFVIDKDLKLRHQEILEESGKLPNFKAIQQTLSGIGEEG